MGILEEIASTILHDSLFDSALTDWVRANHIRQDDPLYVLLAHDDQTRTEIANIAVKDMSKYVGGLCNLLSTISTDALLGSHLKTIFEGLKMLSELPMDDDTFLTPVDAWHHWKLQSAHTGAPMTNISNISHLLSALALHARESTTPAA